MVSPLHFARRTLSLLTHHPFTLPVLILMPHSRCNCRCVMCDIWKANTRQQEISPEVLARHLGDMRALGVRQVVFSGGEALMHSNLWRLAAMLHEGGIGITLLSTGLLLKEHAVEITRFCSDVIVSLDGHAPVHDAIRRIPRAFDQLSEGVLALRRVSPGFPITARSVVQRANFRTLKQTILAAEALGLDQISFLAADTSSSAFNREGRVADDQVERVALTAAEARELAGVITEVVGELWPLFSRGFVAESQEKLRRIPQYYLALQGEAELPPVRCNAPWVSAVVEADGTVRPCFFHRGLGNIHDTPLGEIVGGPAAVSFRRDLDVTRDPTCRRCVCTLELRPHVRVGPGPLETLRRLVRAQGRE